MKLEINAYYQRSIACISKKDEERSVPVREISDTEAAQYMDLLKKMGGKRHENSKEIFYDIVEDSNHSFEYRFIK